MSIRNLHFMFNPSSVVLVGGSQNPGGIGAVLARNLTSAGFKGDLFFVSREYQTIEGFSTYPDLDSLPKSPDLAVIAMPQDVVPQLVEKLGQMGTRSAVVITAGFRECRSDTGLQMCANMLESAQPHLLRILGPNCLGIMVPGVGLNASFGHVQPVKGNIAFVAQSGTVQSSVLDWATSRGIGFSHIVSMGNMSDIDFGDMLDYLATDYNAKAILLYIETVTHARKFMSAARAASRMKPVVVVRAGRHFDSRRNAAAHTGAMSSDDEVYSAAFQRAGVLRVMDMQALFDALETLALSHPFHGDRLAILTNGGGMGLLAADALIDKMGRLSELSPETIARLNSVLPANWSHDNPVDILGDAPPARYSDALRVLLDDEGVDALLVLNCPTAVASSTENARAVIDTLKEIGSKASTRGVFTSWLGIDSAREARRMFTENRIPTYQTPTEAIRGFMQMVRYRRSQEMLMETPSGIPEVFEPETDKARGIVDMALSQGRVWLSETEAAAVLAAYEIPVNPECEAVTPGQAGENAARPGESSVLLAHRANARELMVGVRDDVLFGPVILFGQGGAAVEVIQDTAVALPPLNMKLALEVMRRTRVCRLLEGYCEQPAADLDSIALTLVKVSQLISDITDIAELDINPLLADAQGVQALEARIKVVKSRLPAAKRMAIRPYPKELEKMLTLPDGQRLLLRPIRPEDEPAFQALFSRLSMEEIRLRFLHPMKFMSHDFAARLTQIDYDREMALVLCEPAAQKDSALHGVVRIAADPDNESAEFAILIHRDMTGMGLGPMLMRRIIDYARSRDIGEIFGEVLAENGPMLKLCEAFGFKKRRDPEDPGVMIVSLAL